MSEPVGHRLPGRRCPGPRAPLTSQQNCGSFVPPTTWPGIRGVMTWSINWDASNGYNFASTVAPYLATLP
jgi:chitinase